MTYAFDLANNHYHLSMLYTGLARLAATGAIELDWRTGAGHEADSTATGGMVARLIVDRGRERERLAIDLFDRSDTFDRETLRWCDRYLKRSCYTPDTLTQAAPHAGKVTPFGMNYACRSPAADRLVTSSVARQAAGRGLRSPRRLVGQLLRQRIIFHTYWSLPRAADFEASPDAPREDRVLFQTRVWDPSDVLPDNPEQINGTRVEVVRALRREFGPRFLGGLVPTPFAQRNWPELITNASTRRRDFIQLVKTSRVLVYTRGLHHSIAFKLPEYLAASGAIAAEPIRNEVPADQVGWGGVGAAQDDTREASGHAPAHPTRALVESAALYMSDPVLADGARAASWSCYQRAVRPGAGVLHHLTAAAADACPTAGDQPTEASTA